MAPQLLNIIMDASYIVKEGAFKHRDFINPNSSKVQLATYPFPFYPAESFFKYSSLFCFVFFLTLLESWKNS